MRILINQLKNVGDVLLATTVISLVRDRYPDAWISLLVLPRVAPFFENHPLINEIIPFSYESKGKSFGSMWKMLRIIRHKNFDVNISLDYRQRPALLAFLAGISHMIAGEGMDQYRHEPKKVWYRHFFNELHPITNQGYEHQAETFMKVVRPHLQLSDTVKVQPSLPPSKEANKAKVREILEIQEGVPHKRKILFCVRGTHPEKNWPTTYFAQVIDQTRDMYAADCYIIGAPGDYDYGQDVVEKCAGPVRNICGKTDPADLKALCEYADLLVTVDTGTGHICSTTDTPLISIFVCTNPIQWRPLSEKAMILCYDCVFERFAVKPAEGFIIHDEILPQNVMEAIKLQLEFH